MATSPFPAREADFKDWCENFDSIISLSFGDYGLNAAQATIYTETLDAYRQIYAVCENRTTRSPANSAVKRTRRLALLGATRTLVDVIQAWPSMTDDKREALGIKVRDKNPTPVRPPALAPAVSIVSQLGRSVTLRLRDAADPTRRGRPDFVQGAQMLTFVGDVPPDTVEGWVFAGSSSKTTVVVQFPPAVPHGVKVWVSCVWVNAKLQSGPPSEPIGTYLAGQQGFTRAGELRAAA